MQDFVVASKNFFFHSYGARGKADIQQKWLRLDLVYGDARTNLDLLPTREMEYNVAAMVFHAGELSKRHCTGIELLISLRIELGLQ